MERVCRDLDQDRFRFLAGSGLTGVAPQTTDTSQQNRVKDSDEGSAHFYLLQRTKQVKGHVWRPSIDFLCAEKPFSSLKASLLRRRRAAAFFAVFVMNKLERTCRDHTVPAGHFHKMLQLVHRSERTWSRNHQRRRGSALGLPQQLDPAAVLQRAQAW